MSPLDLATWLVNTQQLAHSSKRCQQRPLTACVSALHISHMPACVSVRQRRLPCLSSSVHVEKARNLLSVAVHLLLGSFLLFCNFCKIKTYTIAASSDSHAKRCSPSSVSLSLKVNASHPCTSHCKEDYRSL